MKYIPNKEDANHRKARKYSFISVVLIIILMCMTISCGTIEYAYSDAQWLNHKIHFQDGETRIDCSFCEDYNTQIP